MDIQIKNKDLPKWIEFLNMTRTIDVTEGTVTAFTNSILDSVFIPKMDETFEYALRYMGNLLDRTKKHRLNADFPAYSLYQKTYNKSDKESKLLKYSFDPMNYFDQGDAPSYETMSNAIKWISNLYKIEDEASFYKDPYLLYAKFQNDENDTIDKYIEEVLFPNFLNAMRLNDIKKEMTHAMEQNKDYLLTNFYPEKSLDALCCYLFDVKPSIFIILHENYFPDFNILDKDNLQHEIKDENERIIFFDYMIKIYGLENVLKTYDLSNSFEVPQTHDYTRVSVNNYKNLSALSYLVEKYQLEKQVDQKTKISHKIKI